MRGINVLRTLIPRIMTLSKAVTIILAKLQDQLITRYRLGIVIHKLYLEKTCNGETLDNLSKKYANSTDLNRVIRNLEASAILQEHPNFRGKAYRVLGGKDENPEDVACILDPFSYVSHLSAMSYHGLTNRLPAKLFLSTPDHKKWAELANERMRKDLGENYDTYCEEGMPLLTRAKFSKIGKTEILRINSTRLGAFKNIRDRSMRVSTIGRTFLDMLQSPELCGGIRHVIEVFENEAPSYIAPIFYEINEYGRPIDKVRAGYILEEHLGIKNDIFDQWVKFATRGGSRKLDAAEEYFPKWSEKWCLSLNIDLPEKS
jgi:predicted transcriptional regulator of viral defense system